jgi:hypothetical protein
MRESASGEHVKGDIGQVPLRRRGRFGEPARSRAASKPARAQLIAAALGVAAALLVAAPPPGAVAAPEPDPHPSATQRDATPAPDPFRASAPTVPTRDSVPTPPSASPPTYEPAERASSPRTSSVERPAGAKPKPQSRGSTKPKTQAKPEAAALVGLAASAHGVRSGEQPLRAATATATAAGVAVARITDPMILGALGLLTLVLSSAGLLLVLDRAERMGARA